jgi:hypothetical protein
MNETPSFAQVAHRCFWSSRVAGRRRRHPRPEDPAPQARRSRHTATNHRLILKDGTYQLVRKYEVVGDRVRYISIERSGDWEELPESLVDWDATRKWERDHADRGRRASPAMKEAAAIDKEEAAERDEAKFAPPRGGQGPWNCPTRTASSRWTPLRGTPELVEMLPSELNANTKSKHGLNTLNPMAGAKASLELDGAHAKVHFHVNDPAIYLSLNARDDAEQVSPTP